MAETWERIGSTLTGNIHLLAVLDTPEGFRVLLQDGNRFVYTVQANAVFYRRCDLLYDSAYADSVPPPSRRDDSILFQVHESNLVEQLRRSTAMESKLQEPVNHFALCLGSEDRVDIVCRGVVRVRAAGSG